MNVPPVEIRVSTAPDPSGLFVLVTVERIRDGRQVRTTMKEVPEADHPTIVKIRRNLAHD